MAKTRKNAVKLICMGGPMDGLEAPITAKMLLGIQEEDGNIHLFGTNLGYYQADQKYEGGKELRLHWVYYEQGAFLSDEQP